VTPQQSVGRWMTALALVGIAAITLIPLDTPDAAALACPDCGAGTVDFVLNAILFIPLGLGLRLAGMAPRRAVMLALALTCAIEILQLQVVAGRDASIGDVIANSLGAALGILLADLWSRVVFPSVPDARKLAVVAGSLWIGLFIFGALAVRPAPGTERLFVQLAPRLAHLETFPGEVLVATVQRRPRASGPLADAARVADAMRGGAVLVEARAAPGPATQGPAPIVSIFDSRHYEILLLGQDGDDAIFRVRAVANTLGLRAPGVRLRNALASSSPHASARRDTVEMAGSLDRGTLLVRVRRDGSVRETGIPLSAGLAWTLVLPFNVALSASALWLSALWLAALLVPAGYWARRGIRRRETRAPGGAGVLFALLAVIAVLMLALPLALRGPAEPWWEWLGALLGASSGWWLGQRLAHVGADREARASDSEHALATLRPH
jgi:glycopeptide antibiotics resistance protein